MSHATRLAPSPTGALHLGNARTFLINWLVARQRGWKVVLRIEDLDGPRIKKGADRAAIDDLLWLGLDWDDGPVCQSTRLAFYEGAVCQLLRLGAAYPCVCTRKEAELAASAPHAEDVVGVYPGTCRGIYGSKTEAEQRTGKPVSVRFQSSEEIITFEDSFAGTRRFDSSRDLGDFVISKSDGTPAYQLAVVVDDLEMGITDVIRGDDLLGSTARQIQLYRAFGMADRIPDYCHVPLIVGADGKRLAKRHGDTRLSYYRDRGAGPDAVIALLARWCGLPNVAPGTRAADLIHSFRLENVPRRPIVFGPEDDARLLAGRR